MPEDDSFINSKVSFFIRDDSFRAADLRLSMIDEFLIVCREHSANEQAWLLISYETLFREISAIFATCDMICLQTKQKTTGYSERDQTYEVTF